MTGMYEHSRYFCHRQGHILYWSDYLIARTVFQSMHILTASIFQEHNTRIILEIDRDMDKSLEWECRREQKENICIAVAYFLANSHPSVSAPFVLLQTFCACAHAFWSGRTAPVTVLPADCCPCELCADVKGVEAEPGDVCQRGAVQPAWQSHHSQEIETWVQCPSSGLTSMMKLFVCLVIF